METTKTTTQIYTRLPLENVLNCRELGGYPIGFTHSTQWHRFLRSGGVSGATESDIAFLLDYGVKTVIDLRTPTELSAQPNPFMNRTEVNYVNVNLSDMEDTEASVSSMQEINLEEEFIMGKMYIEMLERKHRIKEIFDAVLQEEGTVLYHCSAGKDRTGVVSLLLLGLAGAEKHDIVSNYEISFTNLESKMDTHLSKYPLNVMGSHPQNIKMAYDYLMGEYASFKQYFQSLGYNEQEIEQLKNKMV